MTRSQPGVTPVGGDQAVLRAACDYCRRLHARHGRTYYLATLLLPKWKRRHVHALYGFTRTADEIVDGPGPWTSGEQRAAALDVLAAGLQPADDAAAAWYPALPAVRDTARRFALAPADFERFLSAMRMDLAVKRYETYPDLLAYMDGSAAVIGELLLPVLGTSDPDGARPFARELGLAFQLTNFVRDVREDLERGRVYLPLADLEGFGVAPDDLARPPTAAVRSLLAFEVGRARRHYAAAAPGIDLLAPSSRPCVRTAFTLYAGILDEIERGGYDVVSRRARVSRRRRAAVGGAGWVAACSMRLRNPGDTRGPTGHVMR